METKAISDMTFEKLKDEIAVDFGYADYHQIECLEAEESAKDAIKVSILEIVGKRLAAQSLPKQEPEDITEDPINCGTCGNPLTLVRPGKHQCDYCDSLPKQEPGEEIAIAERFEKWRIENPDIFEPSTIDRTYLYNRLYLAFMRGGDSKEEYARIKTAALNERIAELKRELAELRGK